MLTHTWVCFSVYNVLQIIRVKIMQTSVRKVGNSAGMTLPASLLKSQNLYIGDKLDIEEHEGYLVIRKLVAKPKYSLDELLAQCDSSASVPEDLTSWDATESVGEEVW